MYTELARQAEPLLMAWEGWTHNTATTWKLVYAKLRRALSVSLLVHSYNKEYIKQIDWKWIVNWDNVSFELV